MDMNQIDQIAEYLPQMENYQGFVPRADLKVEAFNTLIRQKGYRVLWEQGMLCSCVDANSGQPDYNCPACKGKGYVYFNPVETRVLVTSINGRKEQVHTGLYDFGSAYLTPLSTDDVGFRDRFTFLDFRIKFSQVITKGYDGTNDPTMYPVDKIISVRTVSTVYKEGTNLSKAPNGTGIAWTAGVLPPQTQYSILYTTPPVYIAINPVHELRGTYTKYKAGGAEEFVQLPKQYQIKREDFVENGN